MLNYLGLDKVLDFSVECYPTKKYSVTLLVSERLNDCEKQYAMSMFKRVFGNQLFMFERVVNLEEMEQEEVCDCKAKAGFNLK